MIKRFFFVDIAVAILAVVIFLKGARAQSECDNAYGLCMAGCATDRSAERCMQRCQGTKKRCEVAGGYAMKGQGYILPDPRLDQSIRRPLYEDSATQKRNKQ
jgi:hypothetical protein